MVSLIWVVLHLLKLHNLVDGDWLNISQLLLIYAVLASSRVQSLVGLVLPYWILVICLLICRAMAPRTNPWLWYTPCTIFVGILDEGCVFTRVSIHRKWKRHNSVSLQTIWSPHCPIICIFLDMKFALSSSPTKSYLAKLASILAIKCNPEIHLLFPQALHIQLCQVHWSN